MDNPQRPGAPGHIDTDSKGWRRVLELGADVAAALSSEGKTEVERFLGTDVPPQSIKLTSLGRVVDGVLEPP